MSKSLRDTILCEIDGRKSLEKSEKQRKKEEEKERAKKIIIDSLQATLKKCLEELKDYDEHTILGSKLEEFKDIKIIMEELGFEVESKRAYDLRDTLYFLRIPYFVKRKGNKPTEAQRLRCKFNQELKVARVKRKQEILDECELIKEKMRKGEYKNFPGVKGHEDICVSSQMKIRDGYEKNMVCKFFSHFKISFIRSDEFGWQFRVI